MEYLTSADCAKKWNVSQRRVAIYCKEGRIEGAIMMGRMCVDMWYVWDYMCDRVVCVCDDDA